MNLVAKEYVACRVDGGGVLLLSEFTGAAKELRAGAAGEPVRHRRRQGRSARRLDDVRRWSRGGGCARCAGRC